MAKRKRKGLIPYVSYAISCWIRRPKERRHWWMVQVRQSNGVWWPVRECVPVGGENEWVFLLSVTRKRAHAIKRRLTAEAVQPRTLQYRVRKVVLA